MRLGFGDGFGGCCVGVGVDLRVGVFGGAKAAHALRWLKGCGGCKGCCVSFLKNLV